MQAAQRSVATAAAAAASAISGCAATPANLRCISTIGQDVAHAQSVLRNAKTVAFDVDSTVLTGEGIDMLAAFAGKGDEVAAWTSKAMGGSVLFQDALQARLDIIQPTADMLRAYEEQDSLQLTPHVHDFVNALHARGSNVYLISGGFTQMIHPWAAKLGIAPEHVLANTILFDKHGAYAGFDKDAFTSRSGGKAAAMQHLVDAGLPGPYLMVGDGVTDLEAKPPADAFLGYGGVVSREAVQGAADWFISDFADVLPFVNDAGPSSL